MRILVCGGRDFNDRDLIYNTLYTICDVRGWMHPPTGDGNTLPRVEIISGMARGADTIAHDWAVVNWCPIHEFPAAWDDLSQPGALIKTRRDGKKYDAQAGVRRNQRMLDEGKPNLVVAFPGGWGTWDMIRRARAAGVEVLRYMADGGVTGVGHLTGPNFVADYYEAKDGRRPR